MGSYHDARKDGIKRIGTMYEWQYIIPCSECGAEILNWKYSSRGKYLCKQCREKKRKAPHPQKVEERKKKLKRAVDRIAKQGNDMEKYKRAIEKIESLAEKPQWFGSTEEIMTALQLYKSRVPFNYQVKIFKYTVDFVLPKDKIVLEIDSELFHPESKKIREHVRDEFIRNMLGDEWEVIRVDAENINKHIKGLVAALKMKYRIRKKERESSYYMY
jgi:very-short-patch-repair endonuclease